MSTRIANGVLRIAASGRAWARGTGSALARLARSGVRCAGRAWRAARASRALRSAMASLLGGCLLAGLALAGLALSTVRVAPGALGVQQENWGSPGGLGQVDLSPGLHLAPRGLTRVHQLDARVQLASFGFESEGAHLPALEVRTIDGTTAKVHVQVPFRLRPGGAHAVVAAGLKSVWRPRVEARIEKVLVDTFSRLASDQLLDTRLLESTGLALRQTLEVELAALQAEPQHVSICGVYFPAPYETKLLEKQLESQAIRTDQSLARRARMKTENALSTHALEVEERELAWQLEREIEELRLQLEQRIADENRAATDDVHARNLAAETVFQHHSLQGEQAVAQAQARGEQLLGQALEGPGGRLLIARELAESLRIEGITLDPGARLTSGFFDLDRWTERLAGSAGAGGQGH